MYESIAVEAAFGSCDKWFPLIGRIDIAMRPSGGSFTWEPTQEQWRETSELISRLITEFAEHSQTIRDTLVWPLEFSLLPPTRVQFGLNAHFSGAYGREWESAALAVVDETERLLNELLVPFDPLCDLNSESGTSRAIKAIPLVVPTAAQLSRIHQAVNQFCVQCDIPRVCGELSQQVKAERECLLVQSASPIDFDGAGDSDESTKSESKPDFSACETWSHLYEFLWDSGIRQQHAKRDVLNSFVAYREKYRHLKLGTGKNKRPRYPMPSDDDAKSVLQNYKKQLMSMANTRGIQESISHA